jgi:hypothetical protein
MSLDRELGERLRDVGVPGETEAEERSWEIVRAAYAERAPLRRNHTTRRLVLAVAGGAAALVIGLSPAGAKVGDLAEDMAEAVGIGADDAKPALRSLPAAGELLVESEQGPWIVREDGSKRLLGEYDEASWSPRGLFVAAADGRELIAVEPGGEVRWTVDAPAAIHDPRWGGIGFDTRIAYRSGGDLWVVDGDGSDARVVARDVARVAPAWRPVPAEGKVEPGIVPVHVLIYATAKMNIRAVDVDTGESMRAGPGDGDLLSAPSAGQSTGPTTSPDGRSIAAVRTTRRGTELVLTSDRRTRVLFSARGRLIGPTWSPDGRMLLVGWPAADQWLFIPTERSGRVVAIDRISEQFDPGATGHGGFPRAAGWILPER